jgi:hypothetical protein
MPNGIRFTTGSITGAMRKNNVALGINGDLGPTSTTGLYSMPTPEAGKYIINKVNTSSLPNFFAPQNDTELINLARQEGATGTNTGSAAACLSYFASKATYLPANFDYPAIVTTGLSANYDPAFVGSYPTTGSTWYSLAGSTTSLTGGPTFQSSIGSGSLFFDGINDTSSNISGFSNGAFTLSIWADTQLFSNGTYSLIGTNGSANSVGLVYSGGAISLFIGTNIGTSGNISVGGAGGWKNYTIVRNSSGTITIYTNNSSSGSTSRSGTFTVGTLAKSASSGYWRGYMGNILYYANTELTTAQITQNYDALRGRYGL